MNSMTPSVWLGMIVTAIFLVAAIFGPVLAPYGESSIVGNVWEPFSDQFVLGTDNLGRDVFSRLLFGARTTITIALAATLLSFLVGCLLGFIAAIGGGVIDHMLSRLNDVLMSIPMLIFALVVLAMLPRLQLTLILVMAILDSTRVFRLSRSVAKDIVVMDYVESARLRGERLLWVVRREVLPNALPPLISEFGLRFCFIILFLSALSFLGLGVQPPDADWGSMVRENVNALGFGIVIPLIPAAAIVLLTVSVNLLVDWQVKRTSRLRSA